MGTYGYVRFAMPLFPQATQQFLPFLALLAVIGIIYGALVAMMQDDVKKLVAYSSVSHLGFVMLGIFALNMQGMAGGMIQMINHGISTGALFLIVGFIYERRHTRLISEFGGLAKQMPVFATIFMIITFSSIGLPGTRITSYNVCYTKLLRASTRCSAASAHRRRWSPTNWRPVWPLFRSSCSYNFV